MLLILRRVKKVLNQISLSRAPELLVPSSKSCLLNRPDLENSLQRDSVPKNKAPPEKTKAVQEAVQVYSQCQPEAGNI